MAKNKIQTYGKSLKNLQFLASEAHKKGDLKNALALYTEILRVSPEDKDTLHKIGVIMLQTGQLNTASNVLEKLLGMDPQHIGGLEAMAELCDATKNYKASIGAYLKLITLKPEHTNYYYKVAARYNFLGDRGRAREYIEKGLQVDPKSISLLKALCSLAYAEGSREELLECYKKLYELEPEHSIKVAIKTLVPANFKTSEEIDKWRKEYELNLDALLVESQPSKSENTDSMATAFSLAYHGKNNKTLITKLAKIYEKTFPQLLFTAPHCKVPVAAETGKKIKIGFVSRYFYDHVMNDCFGKLIELLDQTNVFDIYVFSTLEATPENNLWKTFETKGRATQLSFNLELAQSQIAEKQLDVLVYTELGMDVPSYRLAFARLAPAQCVLTGHPETSGVANIDYYISSESLEGKDAQDFFSEKLILMKSNPDFSRETPAPPVLKTREELGISLDKNIYMAPFKMHKVHPDFDEVLNKIFEKDPLAEVVMFIDGKIADILKARFEINIRPEFIPRIKFFPWASKNDFFSYLKCADVIIDSFYFGVGTTMYFIAPVGTPVVTMRKGFFRGGRMARIFYEEAGITELVSQDVNSYVELAVKVANDKKYQQSLRERIIKNKSILFGAKGSVEEYTSIFTQLGKNPDALR